MPKLPDIETLRLCSVLATFSFGLVFAAVWQRRRSDDYLLHWAASSFLYGTILIVFQFSGGAPAAVTTVLLGFLGLTDVLLVSGSRRFDGRAPFRPWMLLPIAAPMIGQAVPVILGGIGWIEAGDGPARIGSAIGLIVTMMLTGGALLRPHRGRPGEGRWIAGVAVLAYVPGYALSAVGEAGLFAHSNLLGMLPMMSDQLLLGVLNLGLLALPVLRAQAQLREAALRDPLTGAWNRLGLAAQQRRLFAPGAAVIAIDVDHFKAINDRHGHAAGDAVLKAITSVAGDCADGLGGAVARTGGDEFIVILPAAADGAPFFAERLRARLVAAGSGPRWTVSLGVAAVAAGETSFSCACERADESLYRAKAHGRDRVGLPAWPVLLGKVGQGAGGRAVASGSITAGSRSPVVAV